MEIQNCYSPTKTVVEGKVINMPEKVYVAESQANKIVRELPEGLLLERVPTTDVTCFSNSKTQTELPQESPKKASGAKKFGVGLASFFLPGLGQAINGEWGKGLAFLGGSIASSALMLAAGPVGLAAGLGVHIWSIADAAKNAKA